MSRAVPKGQRKFNTNSELLLEMTQKRTPCLKNTQKTNKCDDVMGRNKDHLLGKPVNYDQDNIKSGG